MSENNNLVWPSTGVNRALFSIEAGLLTGVSMGTSDFLKFIKENQGESIWFEVGVTDPDSNELKVRLRSTGTENPKSGFLDPFRGRLESVDSHNLITSFDQQVNLDDETDGKSDIEYACVLREVVNNLLELEPEKKYGKPNIYLLNSAINWYELMNVNEFAKLFESVRTISVECQGSEEVKVNSYIFPKGLLSFLNNEDVTVEGQVVEFVFGVQYGIVPQMKLIFSPMVHLQINKSMGFGEGENFNYLRPCPPFGGCPPPPDDDKGV